MGCGLSPFLYEDRCVRTGKEVRVKAFIEGTPLTSHETAPVVLYSSVLRQKFNLVGNDRK